MAEFPLEECLKGVSGDRLIVGTVLTNSSFEPLSIRIWRMDIVGLVASDKAGTDWKLAFSPARAEEKDLSEEVRLGTRKE